MNQVGRGGLQHPYSDFISHVEVPARYLGGELLSQPKDWSSVEYHFVLAFPDIYDIGMSHLGTKILYSLLNRDPRIACERAFTPWPDLERELRARKLPLLSLENARPLRDFDSIGCSLQFELTYTNVLTLLDLGGVPLRAADRGEADPLVWAGGPTATHAEPMAPFFDLFFIGEAEEALPRLLLADARHRREGLSRRERLARLAAMGGVYVPAFYSTRWDADAQREVIDQPLHSSAPLPVRRCIVEDLDLYPFPDDAPVAWAEAVFDRVAVEIARGCQEGCRFCQAGMIYRPLRERHPDAIIKSTLGAVTKGGYDEASLTSLSTADYSCLTPLVAKLGASLRQERVALGLSSLRAYGLDAELLKQLKTLRTTGLTLAPEAGSQRMRDLINKNVTEEDIARSTAHLFSQGWSRMKLYFMIGLPTETDEDLLDIARLSGRLRRLGRQHRRGAEITLAASSHVPKPHTPFQWCAMDSIAELERKQRLVREAAQAERLDFKWHEASISWLEGVLSRGDRRLANVIERAWRAGARFDGWDEHFRLSRWREAFAAENIDPESYIGALPLDARLPWDHIHVGVESSFLSREYQRALGNRTSPPCGKPLAQRTADDAADGVISDGKSICYQCGIGCDLVQLAARRQVLMGACKSGVAPLAEPSAPVISEPLKSTNPHARPQPPVLHEQGEGARYRLRYTKLGPVTYMGHLDTARLLARLFRRTGVPQIYTHGFHPKPTMIFAPALGLGIASLGELVDVRLDTEIPAAELRVLLENAAPQGVRIAQVARLEAQDPGVTRSLDLADYVAIFPGNSEHLIEQGISRWKSAEPLGMVTRLQKGKERSIDVARHLVLVRRLDAAEAAALEENLGQSAARAVLLRLRISSDGSARPQEVLTALLGAAPPAETHYARLAFWAEKEGGATVDLFDLPALRLPRRPASAPPQSEPLEG